MGMIDEGLVLVNIIALLICYISSELSLHLPSAFPRLSTLNCMFPVLMQMADLRRILELGTQRKELICHDKLRAFRAASALVFMSMREIDKMRRSIFHDDVCRSKVSMHDSTFMN